MDPNFLVALVMACVNKKAHCPSISAIKDKYYELYRGKGAGSSSGPHKKMMKWRLKLPLKFRTLELMSERPSRLIAANGMGRG